MNDNWIRAIQDVETLQRRLDNAEEIIADAYVHAVKAGKSGDLDYAICKPLFEILTRPLESLETYKLEAEDEVSDAEILAALKAEREQQSGMFLKNFDNYKRVRCMLEAARKARHT